jgi:ketosteroid isomerase-like protein
MDIEIADRFAIEAGLCRYARALDDREWPLLDEVFAEDAVAFYGSDPPRQGRAAIVAAIRVYLDRCGPSQHLLGNLEIDVEEAGAISRCKVQASHASRDGSARLTVLGSYRVIWRRETAGWRAKCFNMRVALTTGDGDMLEATK